MVSRTAKAVGQLHKAKRLRIVPTTDPVRVAFNEGLANALEHDALAALTPALALQVQQNEVIDPERPGLTDLLQNPDLTTLEASIHRTTLAEAAGCLETAIEASRAAPTPHDLMLCHLMAAAHTHAMTLFAASAKTADPTLACMQAKTAARLMDAVSRASLALHRRPMVAVQQVAVTGDAVVAMR
ncbi:MAG: hypothetical protein EBU75_12710 [Betaproteobacteria bacterium]|nr:hypothetical protein [Betaproteobacteria bacterium]